MFWEGTGRSAIHHVPDAAAFEHLDKLLHFMAHAVTASLLFWGAVLALRTTLGHRRLLIIAALVLLLDSLAGAAIETAQLTFGSDSGRYFSWADMVANLTGAAFAIAVSLVIWLPRAKAAGKIHRDPPA
jgi:VanZ family protein